jgi:transcriptional regulator with XRE-family HTH domain
MKRGNQTKLASKANVSMAFISQILSGKRRPSWRTAKILAAATRTKPDLWLEASPEKIRGALEAVNF